MPLPDPRPPLVSAPARAGVGLRPLPRPRFAQAGWPADWWQRNLDEPILDPDGPDPVPLTERQMRVPPAPS